MLTIENLRVVFDNGYEALKSVNLSVNNGETVGLIGRSGAGKSTILRTLNGIQPVTSGSIALEGRKITGMTGAELRLLRREIGFIWQGHIVFDGKPEDLNRSALDDIYRFDKPKVHSSAEAQQEADAIMALYAGGGE